MKATARRTRLRATAGLMALAAVAGCGTDSEPETSGEGGPVTVRVGDVLGVPAAFLEFAVQDGIFFEHGLDVQVEANPGGAANIPGVVAGDFEIAGSNVVSVLLARSEGLPLKMVSAGTFGGPDASGDFARILVTEDSPIQEPADLDGRSVAINTLANVAEVTTRAALENAGASHENIDFIEMGFPDMIPALQDGQVDAIFEIEPFVSIGLSQGLRPVIAPYAGTRPDMAIGSYFSSDQFIAENPEVVESFIAGVRDAGELITANPDQFRDALVELADLDPAVAAEVIIPRWGGPVDAASVELTGELMVRYGLLEEVPPTADVVYQPS